MRIRNIPFILLTALLLGGALYAGWFYYRFADFYHDLRTPDAQYQIIEGEKGGVRLVEFVQYGCQTCAKTHKIVQELLTLRPDITYIVRPLSMDPLSEQLTLLAFAAGERGAFWEMHNALLDREGDFDESFLRETANLYGLDYTALQEDMQSEKVTALLVENITMGARTGHESLPAYFAENLYYEVPPSATLPLNDLLNLVQEADNR